jgi:hypothetical protein
VNSQNWTVDRRPIGSSKCASQPWSRNTFFAKSIPIIVTPICRPSPVLCSMLKATILALEAVIERGAVYPIKSKFSPLTSPSGSAEFSADPSETRVGSAFCILKRCETWVEAASSFWEDCRHSKETPVLIMIVFKPASGHSHHQRILLRTCHTETAHADCCVSLRHVRPNDFLYIVGAVEVRRA